MMLKLERVGRVPGSDRLEIVVSDGDELRAYAHIRLEDVVAMKPLALVELVAQKTVRASSQLASVPKPSGSAGTR